MAFVVDASITACWALRNEDHPRADPALARLRTDDALVPSLWWFEVRNILVVNERRRRLTEADSAIFLRDLARLPITIDRAPEESEVLRLARTHQLSVHDAAYLELAQRNRVELATLDARLARAARAQAVHLIGEKASSADRAVRSAAFPPSQILAFSSAGNRTRSITNPHRCCCSAALTPAYS